MVHFIGAGPGAEDLITVRGAKLLGEADVIIYAGSLVNPALLNYKKESCAVYDSASMTLEQVIEVMKDTEARGGMTVRLHTGDPSLYGAIREQMDELDKLGVGYDVTPGVSSFSGAAAALCAEYTLPEVSQSVIITRMAGRTPVPEGEELRKMASHGCTMVLFLSTGLLEEVGQLLESGLPREATALQAIGYKEFLGVLDGTATVEEAVAEVKLRSRQYAKRQLTWLRRNPDIHWIWWEKDRDFARALQVSTEILAAAGVF